MNRSLLAYVWAPGFLTAAPAAAATLDLTAGARLEAARDQASSPLLYGGPGGGVQARVATDGALRVEAMVGGEAARAVAPGADATHLGGGLGARLLPRLASTGPVTLRAGAGAGLVGWSAVGDPAIHERHTWAFGTELSLAAAADLALGAADRVELGASVPLMTRVARPPWATTDEALRARSDDPAALVWTGAWRGPDGWARPTGFVRWARRSGSVGVVTQLEGGWLRVEDPAPLRAAFVAVSAGVRVGGGA